MSVISLKATSELVKMLRCVEEGADWPESTNSARGVFLAKEGCTRGDVLKQRILLILPIIYRRWAAYRLQTLETWVKGWFDETLYTIGGGADDAWYMNALQMEEALLKGQTITGGSADLQKAFDQIQRDMLYELLAEAGLPKEVLEPYMRFQGGMAVYNTIGESIGKPYKRLCSIPQGDPLSMVFLTLMLRP